MKPFHIVKWDDTFENAKSRNYKRCSFLCLPNRHDDLGFLSVQGLPNGPTIFGLWVMVAQICSRQERPRDGWLTVDGTPNGRSYTLQELALMLRTEIAGIGLMLQTVSSPSVGWIEPRFEIAQLDAGDRAALLGDRLALVGDRLALVGDPELTDDTQSDTSGSDGIGVGTNGDALASTDKDKDKDKNESKARSFEASDSASSNGAASDSARPRSGTPRPPSNTASPRTDNPDNESIQHAEAKLRFAKLCQDVFPLEAKKLKGTIWPNDWEDWLNEALPLSRQDLELIEWAYQTSLDNPFRNVTRLRQSFAKLLENLPSESQKIASARQQIGLNGFGPNKLLDPEPEGWRAIAEEEYPGVSLPDTWAKVSERVKSRIKELLSEPRGWRDIACKIYDNPILPAHFHELPDSVQSEILTALQKSKMEIHTNAL